MQKKQRSTKQAYKNPYLERVFLTLSHLTLFHLKFLKQMVVSPASAPQAIVKISGFFLPLQWMQKIFWASSVHPT